MPVKERVTSRPRILIADDDTMMRALMADALGNDDYDLIEVDNGVDALTSITEQQPDMVLLDVRMPGMSGFEVCSEMRRLELHNNISIIMVTGLDDSESIEKAFQLGATAFISKPFNAVTLPYQIRYLLRARSAFLEIKQRETHLVYMERISRIFSQSHDKETVLQQTLSELLDIFHADRAFIINSLDVESNEVTVLYEAHNDNCTSIRKHEKTFLSSLDTQLQERLAIVHAPLVKVIDPAIGGVARLLQIQAQMVQALHMRDGTTWYLVLHQCNDIRPWSSLEQETFNTINIRLNDLLSRYLLIDSLHRSDYLLRQAQQIGHLGNWSWNQKTSQVTCSDEIYRIYGMEPGSFSPSFEDFFKVVFEEDNARLERVKQASSQPGMTYSVEHRIRLPDDQIRWVHEQGVGSFDDDGKLIELNGTVQDITHRIKQKEQELHDQKMDAIGQLTSGIAHDFGNLMTIAKGNLELLDESFSEQYNILPDDMDILDDARSAIEDSVELTRQLLTSSRRKSIAPEYLNVDASIMNFSKLFKNTLGDKIKFSINIQKTLPDILVDPAQFESALLNVVINARDAMPEGGKMSIKAEVIHITETADADADKDVEQYVSITLTDTGTGMPDDVIKRATEPFFSTKDNEGTGLGLSMVYGFMKQSNGELTIESQIGQGTCLTMNFPVYGGQVAIDESDKDYKILPFTGETILIVEDRTAVRRYAVRCLDKLNINILEAEDAASAQVIMETSAKIDLMFTDILMPGEMNGRELAAWTTAHYPAVKILLTTASEKEAQRLLPEETQQLPLLYKPYSKLELIEKIHEILQ